MRRAPAALAALAVLLGAGLPSPAAWGAVDPFYRGLLKQGKDAYAAHRTADAVEAFRVASFGLLEEPVLLSEALARLALAQRAAGRDADVKATIARFTELEERYPDVDNVNLRFTDLHRWVMELPDFEDDPNRSNEKILEAIQAAWIEERD